MRKFLVTSVCTLSLSLLGALSYNSNIMSNMNLSNSNISTTKVEQNVTKAETSANENTRFLAGAATQNNVIQVSTKSANSSNCTKNNGQVLSYKNIDLTNCKSVGDVVSTLKKNGCTGITKSNINKNKALKKILSVIKKNCSTTKAAATQANTGKTQPATTPVPTAKPAATVQPTPTPTPTSTANNTGSYASQVLQLVNEERAKAGLQPLSTTSALSSAANKRAQEIKQSFSHTRPDGSSTFTVLKEYNISYRTAGENIAYGQRTPQEVVTGWMNSPGHRANILNANFGKIGIGVYQSNGVYYWTQLFTN